MSNAAYKRKENWFSSVSTLEKLRAKDLWMFEENKQGMVSWEEFKKIFNSKFFSETLRWKTRWVSPLGIRRNFDSRLRKEVYKIVSVGDENSR